MLRCYGCAGVEWWEGLRVGGYYADGVVHDFWFSTTTIYLFLCCYCRFFSFERVCATGGFWDIVVCKGIVEREDAAWGGNRICFL